MPQDALPAPAQRAPRLEYLDGLRGFAAAMVVFHHLPTFVAVPLIVSQIVAPNPWVAIFITLSGFCLYLPAAGRAGVEMPRPFLEFMFRRGRRILPAWYASLGLCLLVGGVLRHLDSPNARGFLPIGAWDIPAHLLLLHSMTRFSGSINGPGYTLGTEWQLYIWMIVLLAIAARAGWAALIAVAVLASLPIPGLPFGILHHLFSPMFGVPFVVGMAAARLTRRPASRPGRELPFLALCCGSAIVAFFLLDPLNHNYACWAAALATGSACVFMARRPASIPARVLSSRAGQALGGFSYSLYLTHFPLLALAAAFAQSLPASLALSRVFLPALPLIFAFAYLFSLVFERPFLNTKPAPRATWPPQVPASQREAAVEKAAAETW